jgi:hypothetical protein
MSHHQLIVFTKYLKRSPSISSLLAVLKRIAYADIIVICCCKVEFVWNLGGQFARVSK